MNNNDKKDLPSLDNNYKYSRVYRYSKKYKNYYEESPNYEINTNHEATTNHETNKNYQNKDNYKTNTTPKNNTNSPNNTPNQNPPKLKIRKKRRLKLWVLITLFILFLIILLISTKLIISWHLDNQKTKNNIQNIDINTNIKTIDDNQNTTLVNEPDDNQSDYYYYIKFPLIQVNFNNLKEKNPDTIAWISVNNTNINYPVVQTTNNNYYLTHSFDKSQNEAGWVFMDYRNNNNFTSKNTIIYAHSRLNKTMFGSLSKVLKQSWYNNKENHIIKISTPTENSLWQIFFRIQNKRRNILYHNQLPR